MQSNLEQFFHLFSMKLPDIFVPMQLRGVRIDPWRRAEMREEYAKLQKEAIERIESTAGMRIMAKKTISNAALAKLLYEKMRLPKQYHEKTHSLTANKQALDKLSTYVDDNQRPMFLDIMTVRNLGVEISTFLDAKLDSDWRLRWSTNLAGTVSGRISTSASPFWTGVGVQNWNEEIRDIVIAEPGHVFVYADGEQAEARAVAFISGDEALQEVFNSGLNVHAQMANRIFGYPLADTPEKLKKLKATPIYKDSKITVHAANYNMSKRKAAVVMRCSEALANVKLESYHLTFPKVRSVFHQGVRDEIESTRILTTPFGRRRQFFNRLTEELIRQAISYKPQGLVGDWMNVGILRAKYFSEGNFNPYPGTWIEQFFKLKELRFAKNFAELTETPFVPTIQIHDGLLTTSKIAHLPQTIRCLQEALTYEIPFPSGKLVIPVDVKIGGIWGRLESATPERITGYVNGTLNPYDRSDAI